jgi:hypothetical protein
MPQEKPKKKTAVRESKPLAETPVSGLSGMHPKTRRSLAERMAKNNAEMKKYQYRADDRRAGKSVKKEKFNRLGSSFTSDM